MSENNENMTAGLDPVEREIHEALARLAPAAVDQRHRDQLLYEAGCRAAQQSLRRRIIGWRSTAAALAAGLVISWSIHPPVQTQPSMMPVALPATREAAPDRVELAVQSTTAPEMRLPQGSYGMLQRQWTRTDEGQWLSPPTPVPAINPRSRYETISTSRLSGGNL